MYQIKKAKEFLMKKMMKTIGVAKVMLLTITTTLMLVIGMVGEVINDLRDSLGNIKWSKQLFGSLDRYISSDRVALC
jgi:hypothetical protein